MQDYRQTEPNLGLKVFWRLKYFYRPYTLGVSQPHNSCRVYSGIVNKTFELLTDIQVDQGSFYIDRKVETTVYNANLIQKFILDWCCIDLLNKECLKREVMEVRLV